MKNFFLQFFTWWNGQTLGTRFYTWRKGERVGEDAAGNVYYQSSEGKRWVIYNGVAEASAIGPGWHGWMHYRVDTPPSKQDYKPKEWQKPHQPNLTGTPGAYRPKGSMASQEKRPRVTGDYDAWAVTPIGDPNKFPVQSWNTATYNKNARFVSTLGEDVIELLAPKHGERILDLGCGDGTLSLKIAEAGAVVIGVDASESFIETAQSKGVDAIRMDGHALRFDDEFDAVFSNAALHWMLEPEVVIDGVVKALKPGGRFVGEFGGFGNVAAISSTMRAVGGIMGGDLSLASPWFFPTSEHYANMLVKAGLSVTSIRRFYRPTPLPTEIRGWLETMRAPFFEQFGSEIELAYSRVIDALRPSLCDDKGNWIADYVRLRFSAELKG